MTERLFTASGHLSTAMMAYGVAALWLHPDSWWAAAIVYIGLIVLMLTPVSRVIVALARFTRGGDRQSALLTLAILIVLAISAVAGWG